jgi:SAM-dependent methyltransferase
MSATAPDHRAIFEDIYQSGAWGQGSGSGSSEAVTRPYRQFLEDFMRRHRIRSVVDIGCGDWQFSRHVDWSGVRYLGVDVSATALGISRQFEAPNIAFREADAREEALPPADLLVSKDVLQHWSNDDILRFLPRLQNYRYALITNGFPPKLLPKTNYPRKAGAGYRPIDLAAEPFNLKGRWALEYMGDEPKRVFLWSRPGKLARLWRSLIPIR